MKVALYARVSTTNGQNPEMQLAALRQLAQQREWAIAAEFTDLGVSGSKESRPQLDAMLKRAYRGEFDALLIWKLDRLGRSLRHLVNVMAELQARNVALVSHQDNIDLSTPSGRLMFQLIGAMAEFERSLIRERVKSGIAHARAHGTQWGRKQITLPEALPAGSIREVAAQLGVSRETVRRRLRA